MKRTRTSRPRRRSSSSSPRTELAWILAFALAATAVGVSAQQSDDAGVEPRYSGLTERAEVDLVLVEAVVLDRRGRHVRDLPRSAFRLRVGKTEVPIVTFDEIDLTRRSVETLVADESGTTQEAPSVQPGETDAAGQERIEAARRQELTARLRGPRWFALVFDGYNNLSPLKMSQIRRAAKKWVDTNMRSQDMVAVYEFNPYLSPIIGFTNNKLDLKESIDKARMFPASSMGREMIAQRLEQGDAIPREFLEQQLLNASNFGNDLLRAERDQFYQNVSSLADVLAGLDGTRAVMMFSGGFPLTRTRATNARGGFTVRFREMIQALEQRGIRVFTYDIGTENNFTDASEAANFRTELERLGFGHEWLDVLQVGAQLDAANAHHEILHVLGSETGGRFWRGKDYRAGLQAADDDLSHYYLIGYRPIDDVSSNEKAARRGYLKMKIDVADKGLRVVSRQGVFPPSLEELDRRREAANVRASWGESQATTADEGERETLDVVCHPQFFPGSGGETLVVLPIRVDGALQPVELGDGQAALDFDLRVAAEVDGQVFQEGSRNIRVNVPKARESLLARGVQIREAMLLPPRSYDLVVEYRLNGLGLTGRWRGHVEVPHRVAEDFGLTELTVLQPVAEVPVVYDVFVKRDNVFGTTPPAPLADPLGEEATNRPPLYLAGGLPRNVPLLAQVQVTAPPPARADRQSPLRMDWELLPSAGGETLAPPVEYRRLQLVDRGDRLDVLINMDLADVAPGEYTLRLTAKNLDDDAEAVRSYPITIAP